MPTAIAARPVTAQELETIQSLRNYVPKLESVDDSYVLRWLRSRDGRFEETAEGLKKNMIFRKAWELDEIQSWQPPEILEKYCGYGFLNDREGNPILMSLLGNMDVDGEYSFIITMSRMKIKVGQDSIYNSIHRLILWTLFHNKTKIDIHKFFRFGG